MMMIIIMIMIIIIIIIIIIRPDIWPDSPRCTSCWVLGKTGKGLAGGGRGEGRAGEGGSIPESAALPTLPSRRREWVSYWCSTPSHPERLSQGGGKGRKEKPSLNRYHLVGLVVRRPPRERKIPGSNPACAGFFSGSNHTRDSKIGTPVATLPGAWRYRVSAGTGRPGVSILWLGEVERLICNFCLSVAARKIVWADPSLRCTSMLLGR